MLRFFRKYLLNKWVLAIGGSVLMVAFLLPMGQGGGGGQNPLIGRIGPDGEKIYASDLEAARIQLEVLSRLSPVLRLTATTASEESMQWLLMSRAAQELGLSTSTDQALVLLSELGQNATDPGEVARRIGVSEGFVIETLRTYGAVSLYKELVLGQDHTPLSTRVRQYVRVAMANGLGSVAQAQLLFPPRVSDPLIERFVYDQGTRVQIVMVPVQAARYLGEVTAPDDATVQSLFDQYRDDLPGTSEPYGFGYREPRRVKFEYLTLPADRLAERISITEAEGLAYFRENRDSFAGTQAASEAAANDDAAVYQQVRDQVLARLKREKAKELGEQIINRARAMMLDDLRHFERVDGYLQIPDDFSPIALTQVADALEQEFSLRPNVSIRDSQWLDERMLSLASGIGSAWLVSETITAPFPAYAMSVREVEPSADSRLLIDRLQAKTPSRGLQGMTGDHFIFRIIDAAPERSPESLDEVRQQVDRDARLLTAYSRLLDESGSWRQRAQDEGLEPLGQALGAQIEQPAPFTRYEMTPQGTLDAPNITGVGRSPSFVRQVFAAADKLIGDTPAIDQPLAARLLTVPVPSRTSLYVVRIDNVTALTSAELAEQTQGPNMPMLVGFLLRPETPTNPLSIELLAKRLHYVNELGGEPEDNASDESLESTTTRADEAAS